MKLSKSSWHYKLNGWYSYTVPRTLCGYFWRTVWYAITLPINIVVLTPLWIVNFFDPNEDIAPKGKIAETYGPALVLDIILAFLVSMVAMWFCLDHPQGGWNSVAIALGATGWLVILILTVRYFALKWADKPKTYKKKEPNLFIEYIKAKKNKYCPIIEWEEEQ